MYFGGGFATSFSRPFRSLKTPQKSAACKYPLSSASSSQGETVPVSPSHTHGTAILIIKRFLSLFSVKISGRRVRTAAARTSPVNFDRFSINPITVDTRTVLL